LGGEICFLTMTWYSLKHWTISSLSSTLTFSWRFSHELKYDKNVEYSLSWRCLKTYKIWQLKYRIFKISITNCSSVTFVLISYQLHVYCVKHIIVVSKLQRCTWTRDQKMHVIQETVHPVIINNTPLLVIFHYM